MFLTFFVIALLHIKELCPAEGDLSEAMWSDVTKITNIVSYLIIIDLNETQTAVGGHFIVNE